MTTCTLYSWHVLANLVGTACIPSRQCPIFFALCTQSSARWEILLHSFFMRRFMRKLALLLHSPHPHLWWELGKVWGVRVSTRRTGSALAVIGYIFIIIYSNRKRYLGLGGWVGKDPHSVGMLGDACFCVCERMSLARLLYVQWEIYTYRINHRVLTSFPSACITFKTSSCSPRRPSKSRVVVGHNRTCALSCHVVNIHSTS